MQVYQLRPDSDHYQWLRFADSADLRRADLLRGTRLVDMWSPPLVVPLVEEGMPVGALGDCPTLGSMPTLSTRAVQALSGVIRNAVELLPLDCTCGRFYVANVLSVVDALDEARSRIRRFEGSGRVMKIEAHGFMPDVLEGVHIFKLPQLLKGRPYVTDDFVSLVNSSGLQGFEFDLVWSS